MIAMTIRTISYLVASNEARAIDTAMNCISIKTLADKKMFVSVIIIQGLIRLYHPMSIYLVRTRSILVIHIGIV